MTQQQLAGQAEALRALAANYPPRFHRLDTLRRYVEGTQYEGRPSMWDDSVPVFERAPVFVYPVVDSAIQAIVDMCLGEGRYPEIAPKIDEDEDGDFALSEDDSEVIAKLIDCVAEQASLRPVFVDAMASAMTTGTAIGVVEVVNGRVRIEKLDPCVTTPTLGHDGRCEKVEIRYPYLEEYKDAKGWAVRAMIYRRVIDAKSDTTFRPAKASEDGAEPDQWIKDKERSVDHNLGFCPVIWHRRRASHTIVGSSVDGRAIHDKLLDEIDSLNWALSLRHRAALYSSDPQWVEIGVDPSDSPAPDGRQAQVVIGGGIDPHTGQPQPGWVTTKKRPAGKARARGVGSVWTYPNENTKVEQLSLPGDALKSADDNARDLRSKIAEAMGVVFIDPDNAKFSAELSGKAIGRIYDRLIRTCDRERQDFANGFIKPIVDMMLRLVAKVGDGLRVGGVKQALPVLSKMGDDTSAAVWFTPEMTVQWGPYFQLDSDDATKAVGYINTALQSKLITKRTAIEELRNEGVFHIHNIDEYLEHLDEAEEEAMSKQQEQMKAEVAIKGAPASPFGKAAPAEKEADQ